MWKTCRRSSADESPFGGVSPRRKPSAACGAAARTAASVPVLPFLFIITAGVLILALSTRSIVVVIIGFVLGGLAYSGVTPTNSAFCRAYFGPAHYPVNFPLINSNLIFASFGSTISGALYDASGSYNATFFLIIGLAAAGILCSLAISAIDKKSK